MSASPERILNLPLDQREAWRALRNAGGSKITPKSDRAVAGQIGWRLPRYAAAMDALASAGYVRGGPEGRYVQ